MSAQIVGFNRGSMSTEKNVKPWLAKHALTEPLPEKRSKARLTLETETDTALVAQTEMDWV